jgi:16S rRNA C1402 N4-methylase RsmH
MSNIIKQSIPARRAGRGTPAKRFSWRCASRVNDELRQPLKLFGSIVRKKTRRRGRFAVISFQSLETASSKRSCAFAKVHAADFSHLRQRKKSHGQTHGRNPSSDREELDKPPFPQRKLRVVKRI